MSRCLGGLEEVRIGRDGTCMLNITNCLNFDMYQRSAGVEDAESWELKEVSSGTVSVPEKTIACLTDGVDAAKTNVYSTCLDEFGVGIVHVCRRKQCRSARRDMMHDA